MATPEKLSLWDRLFHRYTERVLSSQEELWLNRPFFPWGRSKEVTRVAVRYVLVDRVTGEEWTCRTYVYR